jgi:hypothetical protein
MTPGSCVNVRGLERRDGVRKRAGPLRVPLLRLRCDEVGSQPGHARETFSKVAT